MTLRCLFVDFNAFFASVEQYDSSQLRGRPVGVVPVMARNTCCIAASYEAKAHGVKTGTPVWEALERCPDILLVQARPARYIQLHHQLMAAIGDCIPLGGAESIDEVPCWLMGRERQRGNAEAIAGRIKQTLTDRGFSPAIRCSIGIAPNKFLAKTASDMRKPDGLTVIEQTDLPMALHGLELRDLCGIGASMERRLRAAGIHTVEQLCAAPRDYLRAAWGGIEGERYWMMLRGCEMPATATRRGSIGHSHVLGPPLRSIQGARTVLFKLLAKAAMRLRHEGFLAGGLSLRIRFVGLEDRFERDLAFAPLDDTPGLLALLAKLLEGLERGPGGQQWRRGRHPPLSVSVTLVRLEQRGNVSGELIPQGGRTRSLTSVLDRVNRRFGNNSLYFGAMQEALTQEAAPMRIPFSTIPEVDLEQDVDAVRPAIGSHPSGNALWLQSERRLKVLAEAQHRQARQPSASASEPAPRQAAGGLPTTPHHRSPAPPRQRCLF